VDIFGNRTAHICIFYGDLIFRRVHISHPLSFSPSLVAPEKARGFIKILRRKKLRCVHVARFARSICATIDDDDDDEDDEEPGSIDHFPAGIQFC